MKLPQVFSLTHIPAHYYVQEGTDHTTRVNSTHSSFSSPILLDKEPYFPPPLLPSSPGGLNRMEREREKKRPFHSRRRTDERTAGEDDNESKKKKGEKKRKHLPVSLRCCCVPSRSFGREDGEKVLVQDWHLRMSMHLVQRQAGEKRSSDPHFCTMYMPAFVVQVVRAP